MNILCNRLVYKQVHITILRILVIIILVLRNLTYVFCNNIISYLLELTDILNTIKGICKMKNTDILIILLLWGLSVSDLVYYMIRGVQWITICFFMYKFENTTGLYKIRRNQIFYQGLINLWTKHILKPKTNAIMLCVSKRSVDSNEKMILI